MNARHWAYPRHLGGILADDLETMAAHADAEANPLYPVPVLWGRTALEHMYLGRCRRTLRGRAGAGEPAWGCRGTRDATGGHRMNEQQIREVVEHQRTYFMSHATMDASARRAALRRLREAVRAHEGDIAQALHADLGKSADEGYMCETGLALSEIRYQLRHVSHWARSRPRATDLANAVATSRVERVPYGVTLVMAPWNYPFLLTLEPLAGALAAGNTVVVKPSAYAPASSAVLRQICEEAFEPELVSVIEGGRAENEALLDQRWDNIFFTGSVAVGKLVMARAAEHLTPVTLELGGKSPCIVERSANLRVAARRIAFGKWLNVGQTCVAPDYVLVDREIKDELIGLIREECENMYGSDALASPAFGKMVNRKHFDRVMGLIDPTKVVMGGHGNERTLRIEPTIMDNVTPADAVMGQEILAPCYPSWPTTASRRPCALWRRGPRRLRSTCSRPGTRLPAASCARFPLAAAASTTRSCTSPRHAWGSAAWGPRAWAATTAERASRRSRTRRASWTRPPGSTRRFATSPTLPGSVSLSESSSTRLPGRYKLRERCKSDTLAAPGAP